MSDSSAYAFWLELREHCHAYNPSWGYGTDYGYVPTLGAGIAFSTLFGLSMIAHTVQCIWSRQWWCSVFAIGAMGKSPFHLSGRSAWNRRRKREKEKTKS